MGAKGEVRNDFSFFIICCFFFQKVFHCFWKNSSFLDTTKENKEDYEMNYDQKSLGTSATSVCQMVPVPYVAKICLHFGGIGPSRECLGVRKPMVESEIKT